MASKKDFSTANTGRVYNTITEATAEPEAQEVQQTRRARRTYTEQEQQEFREAGKTKGRKGCKAIRINMAFTPEVHRYITTMSRVRGESITDFTNHVFARSMEENAETYKKAQEFLDSI